jgi:hypothetical protein
MAVSCVVSLVLVVGRVSQRSIALFLRSRLRRRFGFICCCGILIRVSVLRWRCAQLLCCLAGFSLAFAALDNAIHSLKTAEFGVFLSTRLQLVVRFVFHACTRVGTRSEQCAFASEIVLTTLLASFGVL